MMSHMKKLKHSSFLVLFSIGEIVKVFTSIHTSLCYDPVWCFLATALVKEFGKEDSYCFLHFIVKNLYPKNYFSPSQNFRAKFIEAQSFMRMANIHSANLSKNLSTTKRVLDCINCSEQEMEVITNF
mgnify:CR=1 FL=1